MATRRSILRRSLAAVGVAGVGTLAGCQEDSSDGDGDDDGSDGGPSGDGPAWASPLFDPTTVGDVEVHGFASYDVAELLSYRDQVPPAIDDGITDAFSEVDGIEASDFDRIAAQGFGQLPDPEEPTEDPPFGWNAVATGSFDTESVVGRLADTDAYSDAGEYGGLRLFEGPPDEEIAAAVGVDSETVIGSATTRYGLSATAAVERAIDADSGDADRYYGTHETVVELMDRHGDGTTAMAAVDPEGSFAALAEENGGADQYEALVDAARGVGRSTTMGSETTETQASLLFDEPSPDAVEDLRAILETAQSERPDSGGPFSDPEVSVEGATVVVSASADTSSTLSTPTGLAVIAPEAAIVGSFVLNLGGPASEREPAPQAAFSFELQEDGRARITHDGGDAIESLQVLYESDDGERVEETWGEGDRVVAGSSYVTDRPAAPESRMLLVWENGDRSQVVAEFEVPDY